MGQRELPSGRFRYEPGSCGSPHLGYMPSIICYKETGPDEWTEHFCLVKSEVTLVEIERQLRRGNIWPLQIELRPRVEETPEKSPCRCGTKDIRPFPISGS